MECERLSCSIRGASETQQFALLLTQPLTDLRVWLLKAAVVSICSLYHPIRASTQLFLCWLWVTTPSFDTYRIHHIITNNSSCQCEYTWILPLSELWNCKLCELAADTLQHRQQKSTWGTLPHVLAGIRGNLYSYHIAADICGLIFLVLSDTCWGLYKSRFKISYFQCPGGGRCILSVHPFQCNAGSSGK